MGGRQFFLSSNEFYKRHIGSLATGRLRIEVSRYISSIDEEQDFLNGKLDSDAALIDRVAQHLRENGQEYIRHIPFAAVWDSFWHSEKPHYFVMEKDKLAIVYAYNTESRQFIGGLIDVTKKRVDEHTFKKFSVYNRPAIVVRDREAVSKFIKVTNSHCYPIFPEFKKGTTNTHRYDLRGWNYEQDLSSINLVDIPLNELDEVNFLVRYPSSQEDSYVGKRTRGHAVQAAEIAQSPFLIDEEGTQIPMVV